MEKEKKNLKKASPVRVLHLIDRITGYGTTKWLWDIVRLTPSQEVEHFVVTFSPDQGNWVRAERLREMGMYHPFPKTGLLKLGRRNWVWFLIRYITMLWHVSKSLFWFRPHIIHVHTNYSLTVGLLLKVVLRRPVVHSVPALFSQMTDAGKAWVPKFYARFHSFVDCFFSFLPQDQLLKLGIPVLKVIPMRGSLDLQEINLVRQKQSHHQRAIRETLHLPSDALIALSVGRLDSVKGHQFALEALPALLRQFPKLHLLIIGEGKQRAELEERAKALGLTHHVHLLSYQSDLLPFYAGSSVYLRTAVHEAENFCSHLAMAMGLPIVGFDPGVENELIKKVGHGILVPNKNVGALVVAVAQILMLPDQGKEMGGRGIEFSQANLDIKQAVEDIATVYKNLKEGGELKKDIPVQ
jgi:glycosyltransferase involved in cell wall biosynthesis